MPVTRDPTAPTRFVPGAAFSVRLSFICSRAGSSTTRNPSTLARIHPGRSTTTAGPVGTRGFNPVKSLTCPAATVESSRNCATACRASDSSTCGPGRTRRTPVLTATSQSITVTPVSLPMGSAAAPGSGWEIRVLQGFGPRRRARVEHAPGRRSGTAALAERGGEGVQLRTGCAVDIGDEGVHEDVVLLVVHGPSQRADPVQGPGLAANEPGTAVGSGVLGVAARQGAGGVGGGQTRDGCVQLRVVGVPGELDHLHQSEIGRASCREGGERAMGTGQYVG